MIDRTPEEVAAERAAEEEKMVRPRELQALQIIEEDLGLPVRQDANVIARIIRILKKMTAPA
jgi:hypothetical protein